MIAAYIYIACALTCAGCAWLLLRGYLASHTHLLLWASLCFLALTLDNIVLFIDMVVVPTRIDLFYFRIIPATLGMILLLFGLIWESH